MKFSSSGSWLRMDAIVIRTGLGIGLLGIVASGCGQPDSPVTSARPGQPAAIGQQDSAGDAYISGDLVARSLIFDGEINGERVQFTLDRSTDGPVTGFLNGLDGPVVFTGERRGSTLTGRFMSGGGFAAVSGVFQESELRLQVAGGTGLSPEGTFAITLSRADSAAAADPGAVIHVAPPASSRPPSPAVTPATVVNGTAVSEQDRLAVLRNYGVQIAEGRYWYDRASGAWGYEGGPTIGYLLPGMPLGGPMRADASGSLTAVHVNGRALHPYDLMSLQTLLGPISPGRYALDAYGNLSIEHGPVLANLPMLMQLLLQQQSSGWAGGGGGGGGGGSGWHSNITGAGGNEAGGSGYVMGEGWSVSY